MMITAIEIGPEDVRAARALLQWSQGDLAKGAAVGISTIAEFEKGSRTPIANNLSAIRRALEAAGVRFTSAGPTIFGEVSLYVMTQTGGTEMRFRFSLADAASVQEIISVFGNADGADVNIDAVQVASGELKKAISDVVTKHGAAVPPLNKLKQIVGSLQDGEHFLLLPAQPNTTVDKLEVERFLHRLNHPDDQTNDDWDELFGALLASYDISNPRTDRRTLVGANRSSHFCRFCGRTAETGATFKKAAHIIPTALGNDHLKSAEECDDCNEYFGQHTEPSLIAMLDIQRVFLGTQGRGKNDGRPELRFAEGALSHDGSKVNIKSRSVAVDEAGTFTVDLGKGASLTPSAVYRALVKMVLSVVADDQLPFLKETIDWVRNNAHAERRLPTVATATVFLPPDPSAQLTIYTRMQPHPRLPHIVGEFRLGCYMYVFAVPFSQQDGWDLMGFFDDADFSGTFKHYMATAQWAHQDLNRQMKVVMAPKLKFVRSTS
ncbi:HNH endonuclease [Rhizobium sp. ICMP 5592]|uniref:HNH endonuclease n=1 Tax=Rhizobium sp. ICMP 5592 TaxID=2292445 RepID=UPI002570B525|nr:HNH endonuclease [Rhizobium sp. ICMP 5592]